MEVLSEPARIDFEEELDVEDEEEVDYDIEEEEPAAVTLQDAETARCDKQGVGCTAGPSTSPDTIQLAPKLKQGGSAKPVGCPTARLWNLRMQPLQLKLLDLQSYLGNECRGAIPCLCMLRAQPLLEPHCDGGRKGHSKLHFCSQQIGEVAKNMYFVLAHSSIPPDPTIRGKRQQPGGLGGTGSGLCPFQSAPISPA